MTKEERFKEIQGEILEVAALVSTQVQKELLTIYRTKKAFRKINRRPMMKYKRKLVRARIAIIKMMGAAQVQRIISTPRHINFPEGGISY